MKRPLSATRGRSLVGVYPRRLTAVVVEGGGLSDRPRDCIDWVLKSSVENGAAPWDIITNPAVTRPAAQLKLPLQTGSIWCTRPFQLACVRSSALSRVWPHIVVRRHI